MFTFTEEEAAFVKKETGYEFEAGKSYDIDVVGRELCKKIENICYDITLYEAVNGTGDEPTERELMSERISDILYFDAKGKALWEWD